MSIKALTAEHVKAFKKYGNQEGDGNAVVILKLFDPRGGSSWYLSELDTDPNSDDYGIGYGFCLLNNDRECAEFGSVDIFEIFNLRRSPQLDRDTCTDLTTVRMGAAGSVMCIERDLHFPIGKEKLLDVMKKIKSGGHV